MSDVLDRLETLAAKATPGPWKRVIGPLHEGGFIEVHSEHMNLFMTNGGIVEREEADAAFVAACDPATVAALVRELRGYREIVAALGELTEREAVDELVAHREAMVDK